MTSAMQCTPLAAARADAEASHASGAALAMTTLSMKPGDVLDFASQTLGEEVAAVLEGRVDIVAAGEHYVLSAGEAILIPPHEARRYTCLDAQSVLYRVVCDASALQATEQSA